jgi:spermidine/putrescine transport system ATP-binding protein
MDHGKVLQIGPPTEIYDRPATKFVADFIGETDLLEAVVEGPAEGGMRFRLPGGGSLTAAESPSMTPGSKATLAFRPERVDVLPPGRGGIPADVTATVYTGTDTMAHLTLAGGVPVRIRLQNREGAAHLLRPGEKIEISVAPAAVRVLAA